MIPTTETGSGNLSTRLKRLRDLVSSGFPGTDVFLGHNAGELEANIGKITAGLSEICISISLGSSKNTEAHARSRPLLASTYQVDVFCNPLLADSTATALDRAEAVGNYLHGKTVQDGGPAVRCFEWRDLEWNYSEETGLLTFSLTLADYRV